MERYFFIASYEMKSCVVGNCVAWKNNQMEKKKI